MCHTWDGPALLRISGGHKRSRFTMNCESATADNFLAVAMVF